MYSGASHMLFTSEATSSGFPIRPAGISSVNSSRSSCEKHLFISVSIKPQVIALTRMPLGASSLARAFVKELMAPFEAEYATSVEAPTVPHMDEMLIIMPSCEGIISLIASLEV